MDGLESLSNAELRSKCLAAGLPNVPITDSSRKILIKKLRLSIGGESPGSGAQKKAARRETLHVPSDATNVQNIDNANQKGEIAGKRAGRRTIAAPTLNNSVAPQQVQQVPQPVTEKAAAPIATRRRSSAKDREAAVSKPSAAVENIPTAIIEIDDEDDFVLAAEQAERENIAIQSALADARGRRAPSLSKSSVTYTSYNQELPTLAEKEIPSAFTATVGALGRDSAAAPAPAPVVERSKVNTTYFSSKQQTATTASPVWKLMQPTIPEAKKSFTSGYPSKSFGSPYATSTQHSYNYDYNSPSAYRYDRTAEATATAAAGVATPRLSKLAPSYIEQSDDTDAGTDTDNNTGTPYLSKFVKNLERLKAEPLSSSIGFGVGDGRFGSGGRDVTRRYRQTSTLEPSARRGIKTQGKDVSVLELLSAINSKYHVGLYVFMLLVLVFIAWLFVNFWQ